MTCCAGFSARDTSSPAARCFERGDELTDDRQRHIGFEQRDPNLAGGGVDVGLRQAPLAAEAGKDRGQAVGEGIEHPTSLMGLTRTQCYDAVAGTIAAMSTPQPALPVAPARPPIAVVMGVSGTGKSTVGALLAQHLGWPMAEGDDFHSAANVAKMHAGQPLTDADRLPWLQAIADWIGLREAEGTGAVVTCSALKRSYRDLLRAGHPDVRFICLIGSAALLDARLITASATSCPRRCSAASSTPSSRWSRTSPAAGSTCPGHPSRSSGRRWRSSRRS